MIKSIVSFPSNSGLLVSKPRNQQSERLVTYYELYKLIKHLDGCILKCGITTDEAFGYFSFFKQMNQYRQQPLIAFEKSPSLFECSTINEEEQFTVKNISSAERIIAQKDLVKKGIKEQIEFVPGQLTNSIPEYLINNPELKIALLTIDLDDYETTLTAMQYFYPRIVSGGILIINNYYKKKTENLAIQEYFANENVIVRHFSLEKGPHYIIKD
jgi:hypothetical protein